MTTVRVAVVQAEVGRDLDQGLSRTRELTSAAAERGATLVVFPETWIPGYPAWLDVCRDVALWDHGPVKRVFARMAENSVDVAGESGRALGAIAQDAGVSLVVGVTERVSSGAGRGTLYNALLTYGSDGTLLNHHRKLVPTYTERMVWGQGDGTGLVAVETGNGRVGGLVCWEHWMPLARQALHDSGEDIHVAVWPTAHEMLQVASRHYAFEGRCFVIAAASLMRMSELPSELEVHPDKASSAWALRGGSAIIAPNGSYVAGPVYEEACTLVADLDLSSVRQESMSLDVAGGGHYSRPDVLSLRVDRRRLSATQDELPARGDR
ncbi:MAG TPA: carbon-nitrogen hydrolase family protein [Gemmatimonadaceae bacterium]|nr:carbon-nitrogen hydrolase family protein [Gemmatimonadaceae bacterium]